MLHNPHECRSSRFPTGGGTLVRFGFRENWRPRMDSHHQPPESESGAPLLSYGAKRSANRTCAGLASLPMTCVAAYALAELKMVGHPGVAPGISPIRTARIAVFLVPDELGGATGNRTPVCAMPLRRPAVER